MGRALLFPAISVCLSLVAALSARPVLAYTPTLTPSGAQVRWAGNNVKLNFAGNPTNTSGLSSVEFGKAVVRSLQRWSTASGGTVRFDYWQGTDPNTYEADSDYNGLSSVYFASNAKADPHLSANVLGLTQVWYNTDTGQILETDIVLNDRDFRFTNHAQDTSGYGSGAANFNGGKTNVFIENVLTHELGHAIGLSHSGGLQSTMLFMESPEQAHLGCDESVAVRAIYPSSDASARGSLSGAIVSDSGAPVFGAHVVAISRQRGTVLASAVTNRQGQYTISALEAGTYFVMAEPFLAGSQALPQYYSGINPDICPGGETYGRSVLTDGSTARPHAIEVSGGQNAAVPNLAVRCTNYGGAAVAGSSASSSQGSAPVVFDGATDGNGFGVTDRFNYSSTTFYRLKNTAGHVEVHAMSYSLYSPVQPRLELLDSFGNVLNVQVNDQVYQGDSGYVNYDSSLVADLPAGDYFLKVTSHTLNAMLYPAGPLLIDSVPFLVITGSVNESAPALADSLPVNARCRMDENFSAYVSPPGNPPRTSTSQDDQKGVGFCGTIQADRGDGPGPSGGQIAGWLLPWAFMAAMARLALRTARRPFISLA